MLGIDVHSFGYSDEGTKPTILCALEAHVSLVDY